MAVQTGSGITVEFLGTIRILVAKYFNYKNVLSAINLAGVLRKSVLILVL
jgi:hypothetical protein